MAGVAAFLAPVRWGWLRAHSHAKSSLAAPRGASNTIPTATQAPSPRRRRRRRLRWSARVKKACGRGHGGRGVGGAGGKVDGAGRARGTLAAVRHFVRVGRAMLRRGAVWRGCMENGRRAIAGWRAREEVAGARGGGGRVCVCNTTATTQQQLVYHKRWPPNARPFVRMDGIEKYQGGYQQQRIQACQQVEFLATVGQVSSWRSVPCCRGWQAHGGLR